MMDRREFLAAAAATVAACGRDDAPPTAGSGNAALGVQLYTVRDLMAEDVAATLDLVAGTGYAEVEFAGYFGHAPAELRRLLDAAGLAAPSVHVPYSAFEDDADGVIEAAVAIGHEYVVIPYLDEDQRSLDDYRRHCENFNRWGEACVAAGLGFGYHNHMFEFESTEGTIPYDLILSETDPGLVAMELDLAWARGGGADAVAYFNEWPGRFPLVHIKDLNAAREEVDIGDGGVEFDRIFAHAEVAGLEHGFVERDHPADARESIRRNFETISPVWNEHMKVSA